MSEDVVARELERLSVEEMVAAAAMSRAPRPLRSLVELAARVPSRRLGRLLARFDADVGALGLARAAAQVIAALGAHVDVYGSPPRGAALVVTNHPGAYDSLATMAAIGRDDVAMIAAERPFLRAMPRVSEHFVFVADAESGDGEPAAIARAAGLRAAVTWLEAGRVLVQYGAGAIERDVRFDPGEPLGEWWPGTGFLAGRAAKLGIPVVPMFVSGVHSARAKRLFFVRAAERRGVTTIAPLVQATMPGFRDVRVEVRFGDPIDGERITSARPAAARTDLLRGEVARLAAASRAPRVGAPGGRSRP
ncbi:MAG: hypothetical protein JST00_28320 [Deltaproteobacteria bacterium]|nr:hypothetical protein [Deltaproteobacteria bacterium]